MTQYLLSVYMVEGQQPPTDEQMQQAYKDVDAYNQELRAAGPDRAQTSRSRP
jgi:hypothetical protein